MFVRTSAAEWRGGVPDGGGAVSLGSGLFEGRYSFGSRFEEEPGTNPEELLGAAHASCFSMALALPAYQSRAHTGVGSGPSRRSESIDRTRASPSRISSW